MKRSLLAAFMVASVSCADLTMRGTSASYLIVESIEAASGSAEGAFGGQLESDVITIVNGGRTIAQDLGRVTFSLAMKDPGPPATPASASPANAITVNRYRVRYIRADGRNTPGADVPHAFDGALTLTVAGGSATTFSLVRAQAKAEAPLAALANNPLILSTIAEITFYGRDQTGREVSVTAWISVHFGDWPDPK